MIRILLVEDDSRDARQVGQALDQACDMPFELYRSQSVGDAVNQLRRQDVDVVLSDISLPDSSASETFASLHRAALNVPVIFITNADDTRLALDAIQQGAQDYLIKGDYSGQFLVRVIRYAIERKKYQDDAAEAQANARTLRHQAKLLRREQEHLRILAKAKDDFISLASHQLRTPATGVKQYIGMLLEGFAGDLPEHLRPFLQMAYESNERQLSIVNDLLRTAQLDAGNMVLSRQPTNLTSMLANIASEQHSKFVERHQKLIYKPHGQEVVLDIDPERMRMVFDNLIDNASKYTPEGRSIMVGVKQSVQMVEVRISDQGVGIAPEHVVKIFEKFGRVANSRSAQVGGSGLGLYWAKQIVDLHGGTIDVRSKVGEGSEFIVRLKRLRPAPEVSKPQEGNQRHEHIDGRQIARA